jgi:rod shape determining protein RodA
MVYTVGYEEGYSNDFSEYLTTSSGKQTIWIGISFVVFSLILLIDWKFWQTFAYLIYGFSLALLVAVLFFGMTIKGATSWFSFGSFSFQPAEIAKFGTCLAISSYLSTYSTNLKQLSAQLIAIGLFLAPAFLIILQPDAGSALIFFSFLIVLYREGLHLNYYLIGLFVAVFFIIGLIRETWEIALALTYVGLLVFAMNFKKKANWLFGTILFGVVLGYLMYEKELIQWQAVFAAIGAFSILAGMHFLKKKRRLVGLLTTILICGSSIAYLANYAFNNVLKPHQQDRINVWLQPDKCDPRGSLYNVLQSKIAIGSGGLQGKGFLKGTMTKLNYVPEQATDFIFCTVGEEQGFVGSFGIIGLFLLLLIRITILAERQRSNFSRHFAYCVAGIIFIHFVVNIGMTMGLVPIIGIPLPFISKGGSSLLGFTIMLAVLLKLDSNRYRI